jgi:hypothetical protein
MRAQFGETEETIIQTTRWCITVPAIWDDKAKDTMKKGQCCLFAPLSHSIAVLSMAGLIKSAKSPNGSPHPPMIVLEPEAASICVMRQGFLGSLFVCLVVSY